MPAVLKQIVDSWKTAKTPVVFTGAGMSTESGLPDFRSQQGLWKTRPESMATMDALETRPNDFYFFYQWQITKLLKAQPNLGHLTLAVLQRAGILQQIITQNEERECLDRLVYWERKE